MTATELQLVDVMILRDLRASTCGLSGRTSYTVAGRIGVDARTVRAAVERLEASGMLRRWNGLRVTDEAVAAYGHALWVCRGCGCVDERACEGGCWWVEPDVCSSCAGGVSR